MTKAVLGSKLEIQYECRHSSAVVPSDQGSSDIYNRKLARLPLYLCLTPFRFIAAECTL